ncbi:class I SAM-dependent methyltransferase [Microterricola pindariensis]|uniref:SAM-dependent methyltransferase n=1 Tax=Microterricola pindariensis TaxID=478010 RepID=A0ABX5AUB3_9MICO|nr:methyltransferase [Microterricola pindariensis]PPL16830.1 SAM-dependent methyltransferase [Microterricola pindariensis]
MEFSALRRWPDVEAENLFAVDASDRLILSEAEPALQGASGDEVVVIGDRYGALTLGALELLGSAGADAGGIRVHQDAYSGELALAANAETVGAAAGTDYRSIALGIEKNAAVLLGGARVVLLQLPRSLDALDEIAAAIAAHAAPDVAVFAGGRIKHMTPAMNDVLGAHFGRLDVSLAQQKSRVLRASAPQQANPATAAWPRLNRHDDLGLTVAAHGAAFAGASVDIGTRFLLGHLAEAHPRARNAIDLGCGTGILATALALHRPELRVLASDQSAAAVASARATAAANRVSERVAVVRDDGLSNQPDASAELIVLNPPFHVGASVHAGIALKLFEHAARVLAPGGQLWCVWNSHLGYAPALRGIVGPTRQVARNAKFTITASTRAV